MKIKRETYISKITGRAERWAIAKPVSDQEKKWLKKHGFTYNRRAGTFDRLIWEKHDDNENI